MKKIIALLLTLVMVMGMVACGNNDAPATSAPDSRAACSVNTQLQQRLSSQYIRDADPGHDL